MALIDKLIEPTKDYIVFDDLLLHLSGLNNEPLYEVVTYLLHHDLHNIGFYYIDMDYKITHEKEDEITIADYLFDIKDILSKKLEHWIYKDADSFNELDNVTKTKLIKNIESARTDPSICFKKSELLSFAPLVDANLLHFDDVRSFNRPTIQNTPLNNSNTHILLQQQRERIAELEQKIEDLESNQAADSLSGLAKVNAERSAFKSTGRAIAKYLWEMDITESIRTGDMVQQLRQILPHINPDLIPDSNDTIRNWLSDIAPPHAKKSGRTPDDAPKEISLIMKI